MYTLGPEVSKQEKSVKDINEKNYVKENVGQSKFDNPFALIRRFSFKWHSSCLYYHLKLSYCHTDASTYNHSRDWFKNLSLTLRKACPYSELFWSVFSCIWIDTEIYSLSLRIQSECGKIRTRATPNTDIFNTVLFTVIFSKELHHRCLKKFICWL